MTARADTCESFRLSADRLRPGERLPRYRETIDRVIEKADIDADERRFVFDTTIRRLPDLRIACTAASETRVYRTRETAEASGQVLLMMLRSGAATFSKRGREAGVTAGGLALFSGPEPVRIDRTAASFYLVGIPRPVLAPMIADPDALSMSVIPAQADAVRLLAGYLGALVDGPMPGDPRLRASVASHVHDLVALGVGATRDAAAVATGRGVRAARLRAIKADIARNLDGDVGADALAARHRVSPRYIRKLFEGEDTSLSRWVLGQRLARVHRMLTDPRRAGATIGALAFEAGFGDLSTFNRQFRRQFGATPSDVRAAGATGTTRPG